MFKTLCNSSYLRYTSAIGSGILSFSTLTKSECVASTSSSSSSRSIKDKCVLITGANVGTYYYHYYYNYYHFLLLLLLSRYR